MKILDSFQVAPALPGYQHEASFAYTHDTEKKVCLRISTSCFRSFNDTQNPNIPTEYKNNNISYKQTGNL